MKDVFYGPKRGTNSRIARPLASQKPVHVCIRSRFAAGKRTMLGVNKLKVDRLVDKVSKRFGVTLLRYANVGNHLHLVVRLPSKAMTSRRQYSKWIRVLTSRIAFEVGGSKKGRPFLDENGKRAKFWDAIPFSRVIHGQRGWNAINRYVVKNELEAQGVPSSVATTLAHELYASAQAVRLPAWRSTDSS